jgi:hypothetical protein
MTAHQLTDPSPATGGAQWRQAATCAQTDPIVIRGGATGIALDKLA